MDERLQFVARRLLIPVSVTGSGLGYSHPSLIWI